ncbi:AraC family transcriptional regulator [Luminiphilus sp.]|nr:AraC family transcriptional regulator [Luminiphilus sp.]
MGDGVVTRLDTLPLNHVSHVLEVVEEFGYDLQPILSGAGVGDGIEAHLNASELSSDLPGEVYYHILDHILKVVNIPSFGVRVGQKFSLVDYGVLGYACLSSSNFRQLLQTFFRFQKIVGSNATFSEALREKGDRAVIEIRSSSTEDHLARFDVEEAIGQWIVATQDMARDKQGVYTRINLSFSRPEYADDMQRLLGCPIFFDQPCNEMVFPADFLDHPLLMANELTSRLCEQQCDAILEGLNQQQGLVDQVRKLIINLPGTVPTPEEIAGHLNVSYRTLRRRLSDEGTSFKEIHNEVRMGMASEYLRQTDLTTQEITYLLGYSEASNFHRAFKAWHGKTPGDYRLAEAVSP